MISLQTMVSLQNISVSFGGFELLNNISFFIDKSDKIGLIGKNGSGKSTLLKILANEFKDYSGKVEIAKDCKIGYLPQFLTYNDTTTVFEEAFSVFSDIKKIFTQIEVLNNKLSQINDFNSAEYLELLHKIDFLSHQLIYHNENECIAQTEKILKGLGFDREDFDRPTAEFSGGWRMRIEIAKILLTKPDLLLLDEPTNHLDINSILWFEDFIRNFKGAVIVVSHDKRFLDNVTNRTIELVKGKMYDFDLPFSKYKEFKKQLIETQRQAYENQQQRIKQIEQFIERFRYKATKASSVQSRIKMLEKMQMVEIDEEDESTINLTFPPAPRSGDIVIELVDLAKSYGTHNVFSNVNLTIYRGQKVAFVGKNGQGKTTLCKILTGEIDDYLGNVKFGHNVSIGYYAQNQDERLDLSQTVWQTIDSKAVGPIRTQLRNILGAFLFRNDDIDKKVSVLSGGERARLALACLILQPVSLLILDEPTNHLDIYSKEVLKKALQNYDGTVIVVSHDRDFLDGLVDVVYEFADGKVKQYLGDINYFLDKKKFEFLQQIEFDSDDNRYKSTKISETKDAYLKKKEQKRQVQKLQNKIADLENKITHLEERQKELEKLFTDPSHASDFVLIDEYQKNSVTLENLLLEWENLNNELNLLNEA